MFKIFLKQYKHLIIEGGWVFFGQISVAVISLIGLRILTEIAPANILGGATLLLGSLTLLRNIFTGPISTTQIRFHPEYVNKGHAKWFNDKIKELYIKLLGISILVFVIFFFVWVHLSSYAFNLLLLIILILYYTLDAIKSFKINRLSAERRQKYTAIWQTIDAFLVNVFFIVALLIIKNLESYLAGQSVGLFIGLLIFGFISYPKLENKQKVKPDYSEIKSKVLRYGLPFIPLALVSWISNLGDRYIIGNYMSLNDVGIYTAVYSIASRPFLMVGGILSGFFRPILFQKESKNDYVNARNIFKVWVLATSIIFFLGIALYYFVGHLLINLFLAKAYSQNVFLIFIIIGIAYAVFSLNQIIENRIFSFGSSHKILLPSVVAAIYNIGANFLLIPVLGLEGAALATLISFFIQIFITTYILFSTAKKKSIKK